MKIETERMRPGYIEEQWPTIGGGKIIVVIPPDHRRPWPDCMPPPSGRRHPFGLPWPQDVCNDCRMPKAMRTFREWLADRATERGDCV